MAKRTSPETRQLIRTLYATGNYTYSQLQVELGVTRHQVVSTLSVKRTKTLEDRFWSFVDKSAGPEECWPWVGSLTVNGYGQLYVTQLRRPVVASRVSLFMANGRWPEEACHRCDNPPCVNPSHLFDGTRKDNMQDCSSKGRIILPRLKGLENPKGKLTEEDVFHIRTLYPFCRPQDLAAAFGVSRGHVVNIFNRRDRANG